MLKPAKFDVLLDGKAVGTLGTLATTHENPPVLVFPPYRTAALGPDEDKIREISGQIDLPAGPHELTLVPRNIVDGNLSRVLIGE